MPLDHAHYRRKWVQAAEDGLPAFNDAEDYGVTIEPVPQVSAVASGSSARATRRERWLLAIIGLLIVILLAAVLQGSALASGPAAAAGVVNERQRIHRYYDPAAGIVCYGLVNRSFTWWYDISCLPEDLVKDIPVSNN